jgi:hypothetical protein
MPKVSLVLAHLGCEGGEQLILRGTRSDAVQHQ